MGRAKLFAIGFGIAALAVGIIASYMLYQQPPEQGYIEEVTRILSERNQIFNEFMSDLLPKMESKQISIAESKDRVTLLAGKANNLHQDALGMNVPEKYRSAHPHFVQGLDYFASAVNSTNNALQYTENALQAGQQLQASSFSIMGSIFGFDSLPESSEMSDVRLNAEAAKAAFNDAINYLRQSEEELETFASAAQLYINVSISSPVIERGAVSTVTKEMLEECKELGIPVFSCSEEQILAKKRLDAGK
jgi:hypothetical protein